MTCTPTMEIDYELLTMKASQISPVKITMSVIQTLTLNDYHKAREIPVQLCEAAGNDSSELPYHDQEPPHVNTCTVKVNQTKARDDSPYVQLELNGTPTLFLVDSGATHTLLSKQHALELNVLRSSDTPGINRGTTATGTDITCYGKRRVSVQLGCENYTGPVFIANIHENGILGMDFLKAFKCILDFESMTLRLHEQSIPLVNKMGERLSRTCFCAKQLVIKPGSESLVNLYTSESPDTIGLIQPNHSVIDRLGLMAAPCLVSDHLLMRVANITGNPITIPAHHALAFWVSTDVMQISENISPEFNVCAAQTEENNSLPELPTHLVPLYESLPDTVSDNGKSRIRQLLIDYQSVFSRDEYDMGYCDLVPHEIHLKPDTQPIRQAPYRTGHFQDLEIEKHVNKLLEKNLIEKTVSPWSSPVLLIAKKDGSTRFVQDYRKLNKATYIPSQPLPRIDDCLESLRGSKFFSTFDLLSGYWQCALSPEAKEKVAFCTKSGVYTWKVLGMGLCGAPATFERLMEKVMQGLNWRSLLVYLDDIIVFSTNENSHIDRLKSMLERLLEANLKIKPSKTHLMQSEVEFLGHIVNEQGIHTDPAKVKAVQEVPSPTSIGELRSFLGFTGYYRKFIAEYAEVAAPLYNLLKKKTANKGKLNWTSQCQQSFQSLKQKLIHFTTLSYPDWTKQFILDSDCSGQAIGAVLAQKDDDNTERPIAFYSKKLSDSQRKYSVTKQEMLALVSAIRHFHTYLYGGKFLCRVDHHSLIWLHNIKNPQGILARWLETLGSYDFEIEHRPGRQHINADALSRFPINEESSNESEDSSPAIADPAMVVRAADVTVGISMDEFAQSQKNDPNLLPVITCIKEGKTIPHTDTKQYSRITRYYLGKLENLKLQDELLMMYDYRRDQNLLIVPDNYQNKILQSFHELDHAGMDRTESRIKLYYFWYAIQSDVRKFIQSCTTCQKSKLTRNSVNQRNLSVGSLMDQVSLDFVGPLTTTSKDNSYILIAIEHFSRWAEAYPLAQPDAESCAKSLYNGIFSKFGFCRILHSDRGSAFVSQLMKELSTLGQCKQTFSARYHPMGNSYAERVIGSVTSSLRTCVQDVDLEWDELLDTVMMAYRSTPHSATGFTPNMIMLGREIRLPSVLNPPVDPLPVTDHVRALNDKLRMVYNKCLGQPISDHEAYDHLIHKPFSVGDSVWVKRLRTQVGRPGKLEAKYHGPYPIIKVLDYDTYLIQENNKEVIEHHTRLKMFHPRSMDQTMGPDLSELPDEADTHDSNDSILNPTDLATQADLPEPSPDNSGQGRPRRQRRPPKHYDVYEMGDEYI